MHRVHRLLLLALGVAVCGLVLQASEEPIPKVGAESKDAESAIRANVQAFIKAYNAGDAKGVSQLFAPEAQMIDEDGNTTQGREAIEKVFAAIFADAPGNRVAVNIESIRMIGTAFALETGDTKVIRKTGEVAESTRYTVAHIKNREGQWLMALVRDTPEEAPSNYERLKALEWLVGDWIDESHESVVMTSCRWNKNKNFLMQEIKIRMRGRDAMNVTQRIGWDPLAKRIKAWMFDSEGGYGESVWVQDGDRWLVKATGVRRDGVTSSATNMFTRTGNDSYTWHSSDRVVGHDVMPPIEIKVVRKPPAAANNN